MPWNYVSVNIFKKLAQEVYLVSFFLNTPLDLHTSMRETYGGIFSDTFSIYT